MKEPEIIGQLRLFLLQWTEAHGISSMPPRVVIVSREVRDEVANYNEWYNELHYGYNPCFVDFLGDPIVYAKGIELVVGELAELADA